MTSTIPPAAEAALLTERYWDFLNFKRRAPVPQYIEIKPNWRELLPCETGASGRLIQNALGAAANVLDVGAGDRYYASVFEKLGLACRYASVDTDSSANMEPHDYSDFLKVSDRFDAIIMFEVIEHLPLDLGVQFLAHARSILTPGGVLLLSTPNAHHPNHVWRIEVTHVRPWPAPDLYGVLRLVGFESVDIVRQYIVTDRRRFARSITKTLYCLMELDWAHTIIAVCR